MLTRIIRGDNLRKSRFHDEKGNLVTLNNALAHAPAAIFTGLLRLSIGYRPELPWIGYSAIRFLKQHLKKDHRVLEYGSGMSTIWYAKQSGRVSSVEDNEHWYNKVKDIFVRKKIDNVEYRLAMVEEDYSALPADANEGYDLIVVDGRWRSTCVAKATPFLKPGGILYLDNSDKDSGSTGGDMRQAESIARQFAAEKQAQIIEFTDFAPTQLFVQQGLAVVLPR